MRRSLKWLASLAMVLWAASAWAGVVISEDDSVTSARTVTPWTTRRVRMIQGDDCKITGPGRINDIIVDLKEKRTMVVHPYSHNKDFFDLSYPPEGTYAVVVIPELLPPLLKYTKTGKSSTVAGYKCDIYSATGDIRMRSYTVDACYSTVAPGAKEYSDFAKKAASKVEPIDTVKNGAELPDGIPLHVKITAHSSAPLPALLMSTTTATPAAKPQKSPAPGAAKAAAPAPAHPAVKDPYAFTEDIIVVKIDQRNLSTAELSPPAGFVGSRPKILFPGS
jgi:hypothetical protein